MLVTVQVDFLAVPVKAWERIGHRKVPRTIHARNLSGRSKRTLIDHRKTVLVIINLTTYLVNLSIVYRIG